MCAQFTATALCIVKLANRNVALQTTSSHRKRGCFFPSMRFQLTCKFLLWDYGKKYHVAWGNKKLFSHSCMKHSLQLIFSIPFHAASGAVQAGGAEWERERLC